VAEELHFGRAAARLNISQPPLSQQISRLEAELKVKLFSRGSRKVELTSAGHVFVAKARRLLVDFGDSVLEAQRAHRGEVGQLVIGTIPVGSAQLYQTILPAFRDRHRGVRLVIRSIGTAEQIEALHSGQIDIGVLRLPVHDPLIEIKQVFSEKLVVAVPTKHRFAKGKAISIESLIDEPQVMFSRTRAPDYFDFIMKLFRRPGKSMTISLEVDQVEAQLGLVAAGFGVSLMPAAIREMRFSGVVYRPLQESKIRVESAIAILRGRNTNSISEFTKTVHEVTRRSVRVNPRTK
jgi:DNA-binding transcriptional LysR family regulator